MFESTIINKLAGDATLTGILTTFAGQPSIFSNDAPEDAVTPFVIITISGGERLEPIQMYSLFVDYYDFFESRVNARIAARRIQYQLDNQRLQPTNFTDIRVWQFGGATWISGEDPRDIHINQQFYIRATLTNEFIET